MVKRKSKTKYQRELAKLKAEKAKSLKLKRQLLARRKEMNEIRALKKEIHGLSASNKKVVAGRLAKAGATTGWKGLKIAGRFVKGVIDAEAKAQARDRARAKPKPRKKKR